MLQLFPPWEPFRFKALLRMIKNESHVCTNWLISMMIVYTRDDYQFADIYEFYSQLSLSKRARIWLYLLIFDVVHVITFCCNFWSLFSINHFCTHVNMTMLINSHFQLWTPDSILFSISTLPLFLSLCIGKLNVC